MLHALLHDSVEEIREKDKNERLARLKITYADIKLKENHPGLKAKETTCPTESKFGQIKCF